MCSIQSIPKLRFCNLGCRLLLNQHHQHGSSRLRMFRPYSMNTLATGGPTVVINHCALVDCFQLISSRLSHSQLDARSAAWLSLWIALFLSLPLGPCIVVNKAMLVGNGLSCTIMKLAWEVSRSLAVSQKCCSYARNYEDKFQ